MSAIASVDLGFLDGGMCWGPDGLILVWTVERERWCQIIGQVDKDDKQPLVAAIAGLYSISVAWLRKHLSIGRTTRDRSLPSTLLLLLLELNPTLFSTADFMVSLTLFVPFFAPTFHSLSLYIYTDGSHVSSRRLFKDNHQRWKAWKEAGPHPSFVQGYCQVFAMYAATW